MYVYSIIKFSFLVNQQKEQHAVIRLILSRPSCKSFNCYY